MADIYNEGETVSMLDVLEEDAALEDEANAVLGASDDTNCTYPLVRISVPKIHFNVITVTLARPHSCLARP